MKTLNQFMVFACALSLFAACGSDNDETSAGQSATLRISTNITQTRAVITGTNFSSGDSIGIFALNDKWEQYDTGSMNVQSVYDGSKWSFPSGRVALTDAYAQVFAYYPYNAKAVISNVPIDITPDANGEQIDYLYGYAVDNVNASHPEAQITFKHALALVDLVFKCSDGGTTGLLTNVMLKNAPSQTALALKGSMNAISSFITPTEDTYAHLETSLSKTLSAQTPVVVEYMIMPVDLSNNNDTQKSIILSVTIGGKVYEVPLPATVLKAGTRNTFPITVSVNDLSVGQCAITPWGDETVSPITVTQDNYSKDSLVAVDMGLSVKWASYNVGAMNPEELGDRFAWGETETKSVFADSTYAYYDVSTKTYTDIGSSISGTQHDVAHVKWGGSWRMPTKDELTELRDSCTWTSTTIHGVGGYIVTSKKAGYTDKGIFLPSAIYWSGTIGDYNGGSWGIYSLGGIDIREPMVYLGLYVRPVSE